MNGGVEVCGSVRRGVEAGLGVPRVGDQRPKRAGALCCWLKERKRLRGEKKEKGSDA